MKEQTNSVTVLPSVHFPGGVLHAGAAQGASAKASPPVISSARTGIEVLWAKHLDEVRQAQRLRFNIFSGEMGGQDRHPGAWPRH